MGIVFESVPTGGSEILFAGMQDYSGNRSRDIRYSEQEFDYTMVACHVQ